MSEPEIRQIFLPPATRPPLRPSWRRFVPRFLAATFLLALVFFPGIVLAQNITVTPTTPLTINEGSSADVTFSLDSQPSDISYSVDIFPRTSSLISFNKTTFNIHRNDWQDTQTLTVTASQDANKLSGVTRFSISPEGGSVINVYVTVLDDEDSTGPAVTSGSSGYYSNKAATTPLTGPVKGGKNIYTKVVFGELVKHKPAAGRDARPEINYKIGSGSGRCSTTSCLPPRR